MSPKLTRKYPTDQKTTTPEGYREYKKLQMQERRTEEKEAKMKLTETLNHVFYDQPSVEIPQIPNASVEVAEKLKLLQETMENLTLAKANDDQIFQAGLDRVLVATKTWLFVTEADIRQTAEAWYSLVLDLINIQPLGFKEKQIGVLNLLVGIKIHTLKTLEKRFAEGSVPEKEKRSAQELKSQLEREIKVYYETLQYLKNLEKKVK